MKNREEFEEYVRGLAEKKLASRQARKTKIRRAVFGFGSCAVAGICVALAVHMNLASGSFGRKYASSDIKGENFIDVNEKATVSNDGNGSACAPPQDNEHCESGSDGTPEVYFPNDITAEESFGIICESEPDYVNINLKDGSFILEEKQNISSVVNALNSIELNKKADIEDRTAYITLELVYPDQTVTCIFTENSLEVTGQGNFAVEPEDVSEFAEFVESLTVSAE